SISPADGTFSPTSCTLGTPSGSSSKCSTTFTASSGGNATITGNYNRSSNFWANNTTGTLPVTVNQAPAITSANSTTFKVGTAGTAGSYSITLISNNGVTTNATQSFTLTVAQVPVITSANSATFGEGTPGTFTVTASGFPAPAFSENGALPSGVAFNTATGVLSGTPATGTSASSPYSITFTASNLAGTSPSQSFTLTVLPPPTAPSAPVLLPSTTGNPEDNVTTSTTPSFYGTTTGSI